VPEIETDTGTLRQLSLRVREHGTTTWAKPIHIHSIELAWSLGPEQPKLIREMAHLETVTSNPIAISFEENERGQRVYYAARWLNNTAQPGPWSEIESAYVP